MANKINPQKLLLSKWTAVKPDKKELHFIVTELVENDEGEIIACMLEAIMTRNVSTLNWHELKNTDNWLMGWK
jgi:tryptophan-rich hypothetical protein